MLCTSVLDVLAMIMQYNTSLVVWLFLKILFFKCPVPASHMCLHQLLALSPHCGAQGTKWRLDNTGHAMETLQMLEIFYFFILTPPPPPPDLLELSDEHEFHSDNTPRDKLDCGL